MLENFVIKGLLMGIVFGGPAGAIGALSIQRTLSYGFLAGFSTGLGSTAADLLYACVGIFGITVVSDFILSHETLVTLIGAGLLMGIGILIFRKKSVQAAEEKQRFSHSVCFGTSFAVAIANPATILSFFFACACFGVTTGLSASQGLQLVAGILLGTCIWWGAISGAVSVFRNRITGRLYQILNRILGSLMILLGAAAAGRVLFT